MSHDPRQAAVHVRRQMVVAAAVLAASADGLAEPLVDAATRISGALRQGRKLLLCGNGGSAADAQHVAAELVGRFLADRRALPAIALTTDSSSLTAIANDSGFERVFARQVEALGVRDDVLIAISTSGRSPNVVAAATQARSQNLYVIAFTGEEPSALSAAADLTLAVPARYTPHVQQAHIALLHVMCELIEQELFGAS